jgi:hypothetical protein
VPKYPKVIDSRFLLALHMFLLEVIGMNNSSSLPFQMHLRLFPKKEILIATCLPPFG